jgi:perosamine synthetase
MRADFLPFGKPSFGPEEEEAILRVLRSGWIGMGPETIAFEQELAEYIGTSHAVTVNSCTSALFLSLLVSGVQAGDEVIVPSLTWCSTANAALFIGATPVMCDVDPDTMCASWETIRPHVTSKTKAVIVVHYGGLAAETQKIREELPGNIALIEDAAHAFGALHADGSKVGSHGNLTCFSFYANKNLSTGEGGAIVLNDPAQADRLKRLRLHGLHSDAWKRFQNKEIFDLGPTELGYKMNFTDMQACIGRVQLRRQPEFHRRRRAIAARYRERLPAVMPRIEWQAGWDGPGRHVAHLFVVKLDLNQINASRDEFLLLMRDRNIGAAVHYTPLHLMPFYNRGREPVSLPNAESLADRILTLPISASMRLEDCEDVLKAFREAIDSRSVTAAAEMIEGTLI